MHSQVVPTRTVRVVCIAVTLNYRRVCIAGDIRRPSKDLPHRQPGHTTPSLRRSRARQTHPILRRRANIERLVDHEPRIPHLDHRHDPLRDVLRNRRRVRAQPDRLPAAAHDIADDVSALAVAQQHDLGSRTRRRVVLEALGGGQHAGVRRLRVVGERRRVRDPLDRRPRVGRRDQRRQRADHALRRRLQRRPHHDDVQRRAGCAAAGVGDGGAAAEREVL